MLEILLQEPNSLKSCKCFAKRTNTHSFVCYNTSVIKPTLGQPFLGLLSGCANYPGEFYVVLFNKMSRESEKLGLLSGWAYYPGTY